MFKIVQDNNGYVLVDTDRDLPYTMDDLAHQRGTLAGQVAKLTEMPALDTPGNSGGMRAAVSILEGKIRQLDTWIAGLVQRNNELAAARLCADSSQRQAQTPVPASGDVPDPLQYAGSVTETVLGPHWQDLHGNFYSLETLRQALKTRQEEIDRYEAEITRLYADLRWSTGKMVATSRAVAELQAAQIQSDLAHTLR